MSWKKNIFKRKGTEIVMIRRLGRNLFPGEKKPENLWSDGLEEDYFQEKRYDNYYDLMIWRCLYSRENILKTLFFWWHWTGFFSRINLLKTLRSNNSDYSYLPENWYKMSYKLMIWKKLISREIYSKRADLMTWKKLISREMYSKRADLMTWKKLISREMYSKRTDLMTWKRLVFKRRHTNYVLFWWFGEAYIHWKRYWTLSEMMSWKKNNFKRKETEIVMIRRLGRNLFPGEKKPKTLWSDGLEEDYFQE